MRVIKTLAQIFCYNSVNIDQLSKRALKYRTVKYVDSSDLYVRLFYCSVHVVVCRSILLYSSHVNDVNWLVTVRRAV